MPHEHAFMYKTENHSEEKPVQIGNGIFRIARYCWSTAWEECECGATRNKTESPRFEC